MNDEFLQALRREPPPRFASELKRRLDRQSARSRRSTTVRTLLAVLLIGGVAMAAALLLRERRELSREDAPVAQATAPSPLTRAVQPAASPRLDRHVARSGSAAAQPEATESVAQDIPVAVITSSSVRSLTQALVGRLTKYGYYAQPRVMTMDDDEAVRALCGNTDFVIVTRRIADNELALCRKWGIDIVEWKLGYQAVVLTAGPAAERLVLTPRHVFLALARRIPDPAEPSRLIENPNLTWHDVDARFESREIAFLASVDASTSSSFLRLVMEPGCQTYPWIRSLKQGDRQLYEDICYQLRTDGRSRDVSLSSAFGRINLERLLVDPKWLVVLDYSLYMQDSAGFAGTMLDGPAPTLATLTDGTYPAARPIYVYAQRSHLDWNAAARTLAHELTNEDAVGPQGYLLPLGFVPLDDISRRIQRVRPPVPLALESLQP